jgi:hypothetical protein
MVVGRQVFHHPAIQGRHYILDKLTAFHRDHDTGMAAVLRGEEKGVGSLYGLPSSKKTPDLPTPFFFPFLTPWDTPRK